MSHQSNEMLTNTSFPERKSQSIFNTLNDKSQARMLDRYNVSKLLEVFACREIALRHPVDQLKVTLDFVNPGFCHSELIRDPGLIRILTIPMKALLARTTEVGSRTLVDAGLRGPEAHGKYLSDCQINECAALVLKEPETQKRVWEELAKKLEEIEPGVTKNLDGPVSSKL
jgi:hypothetical protein